MSFGAPYIKRCHSERSEESRSDKSKNPESKVEELRTSRPSTLPSFVCKQSEIPRFARNDGGADN
jgi:hypothetical protein